MSAEVVKSLYLHIPFCKRKCFYCDFAITTGGDQLKSRYVAALCRELELTAQFCHPTLPLQTIFFGGGTPSLLSAAELDKILSTIDRCFGIDAQAEISLEANPGTITLNTAKDFKVLGVNRISLGAQAFQDELLDACGRGHTVAEIYEAVEAIRRADMQNLSLDLISGLPHQTLEQWQASLMAAIALQPQHLSVYDLIVEPTTAFAKRYQPGATPLPSEETTVEMFLLAREKLQTAGYQHYEISNYAVAGWECQHNLTYWRGLPFYGVGMAASSYINRQRIDRPRKIRDYFDMVSTWDSKGREPSAPIISEREELIETLMQGLRLAEGISISKLYQQFDQGLLEKTIQCLHPYVAQGWVHLSPTHLSLVPPQGWLFSDVVIQAIFDELSET